MASSKVFLLCSLVILTTFIDSTQSASCCLMYGRRPLPCKRLLGYTIQTIKNSCDINAVIFHIPGRFVCADPSANWTQRLMKCFDQRRMQNSQILASRAPGNTTSPHSS